MQPVPIHAAPFIVAVLVKIVIGWLAHCVARRSNADLAFHWGELYRELPRTAPRPVDLRLIPYHAWGNRGRSEMTVWMPLGR